MLSEEIKTLVAERYNKFSRYGGVKRYRSPGNMGPGLGCIGQKLYTPDEIEKIPNFAFDYSMGCTTPTRLVEIKKDNVVLDIGCGVGIDVILAAKKVGDKGRVYGIDISTWMIKRATKAAKKVGLQNVEFHVADMEKLPLKNSFVNIIISNGAINLSIDKVTVFNEAYRVMKPGGKMAIADIVTSEKIDPRVLENFKTQWLGCMGGATSEEEYLNAIKDAGFKKIEVLSRRKLCPNELSMMVRCPGEDFTPAPMKEDVEAIQGKVISIKIIASKL
ncbi:MAG: hypothetical protein APF76_15070 [Desulfitibacter sp. BRH_c19]|nr:MAG: hypothetical protein APF76_15070 [Desulfitibacter sp. BRH_c19]